jgi:hypothetical protein
MGRDLRNRRGWCGIRAVDGEDQSKLESTLSTMSRFVSQTGTQQSGPKYRMQKHRKCNIGGAKKQAAEQAGQEGKMSIEIDGGGLRTRREWIQVGRVSADGWLNRALEVPFAWSRGL